MQSLRIPQTEVVIRASVSRVLYHTVYRATLMRGEGGGQLVCSTVAHMEMWDTRYSGK